MRHGTSAFLLVVVLSGATAAGQAANTTADTKVKSDNGKVVIMTGCLEIGTGGTSFMLTNITSQREQHGKPLPPAGGSSPLIGREGLDLGPFINQKVELTGVVVPAATKSDADDKITIKEPTKVDGENGRDKKASSAKTVKVARGPATQFVVASVKALAPSCQK